MADTYDYLKVSDGTGDAALMHITNPRLLGATIIQVDTVVGVPAFFIGTFGTLLSSGFIDPTTKRDFYGHTNAGTLVIDGFCAGSTDVANTAGQVVVIKPNTQWANDVITLAQKEHNNDGTHAAVTATSLSVAGQDISLQHLYRNAIINGGCLIAQRAIPNISTAYQYGKVDRFAAKATGTAVSAGTIDQNTGTLLASQIANGAEIKLAGVTVTGTGIIYLRYRMEAADAAYFKNAAASFQCRVYHDTGSTINATININKPTVADNFTSTTLIAASAALPIVTATGTTLKFENINSGSLGDCSNGLEIEIQIACGAVTTRNFYFADFCLQKAVKSTNYAPRPYQIELAACQRYYEKTFDPATAPANGASGTTYATSNGLARMAYGYHTNAGQTGANQIYAVSKRALPTITFYGNNVSQWQYYPNGGAVAWGGANQTNSGIHGFTPYVNSTTTNVGVIEGHWSADAEL